jgi:hypothetical protein
MLLACIFQAAISAGEKDWQKPVVVTNAKAIILTS